MCRASTAAPGAAAGMTQTSEGVSTRSLCWTRPIKMAKWILVHDPQVQIYSMIRIRVCLTGNLRRECIARSLVAFQERDLLLAGGWVDGRNGMRTVIRRERAKGVLQILFFSLTCWLASLLVWFSAFPTVIFCCARRCSGVQRHEIDTPLGHGLCCICGLVFFNTCIMVE